MIIGRSCGPLPMPPPGLPLNPPPPPYPPPNPCASPSAGRRNSQPRARDSRPGLNRERCVIAYLRVDRHEPRQCSTRRIGPVSRPAARRVAAATAWSEDQCHPHRRANRHFLAGPTRPNDQHFLPVLVAIAGESTREGEDDPLV